MPSQTRAPDPLLDNPQEKRSIDPPPAQQQPKANFQSPLNDPESQGIGLDGLGHCSGNSNDPGGASAHSARQGVPKSANNHPNVNGSGQSGSSTLSDNTKYPCSRGGHSAQTGPNNSASGDPNQDEISGLNG